MKSISNLRRERRGLRSFDGGYYAIGGDGDFAEKLSSEFGSGVCWVGLE